MSSALKNPIKKHRQQKKLWQLRTLVVGPESPVDGDSLACTKALINHLRRLGKEAYTLPVRSLRRNMKFILDVEDLHQCLRQQHPTLVFADLQGAYDCLIQEWQPDEIVVVDGRANRIGFETRGVATYTIDHHTDEPVHNEAVEFIRHAPSAGCLLVENFRIYEPILAASILSDTRGLQQNQPALAIRALNQLVRHGLTDELLAYYQKELNRVGDDRVLLAVRTATLRNDRDDLAFVTLNVDDVEIHQDVVLLLQSFYAHLCVVRKDGYVSFRTTDMSVDLGALGRQYNGGGHRHMSVGRGVSTEQASLDKLYADFIRAVRGS